MKFNFFKKKTDENSVVINNTKIVYNIMLNHLLVNLPTYYFGDGFYVKREIDLTQVGFYDDIMYSVGEFSFHKIDKKKEVMMDNYLLNLETKVITNLIEGTYNVANDAFIKAFNEETSDAKLKLRQNIDGSKSVLSNGKEIIKLRKSAIEKIDFQNITQIDQMFLPFNKDLKKINIPNVQSIGKHYLIANNIVDKQN
jgi:hypothetical protein